MDWNSPTTKKHIKEAETHGCKLLGPGKSSNYRLYKLDCGHKKEVKPPHLRDGNYRCEICAEKKLRDEAKAHDAKLLGPGKNCDYRLYKLKCKHEQQVMVSNIRKGEFACQTCLAEKFRKEAAKQQAVLMGPGKNRFYRIYRLRCGHEQEVQTQKMRDGAVRCDTCLTQRLNQEAKAQGAAILGPGSTSRHRFYRLRCGHKQEVETGNMRRGNAGCNTCQEEKFIREAKAQKCKILGAGRNANYRLYRLPCGHEREIKIDAMRLGSFVCQTCEETSRTLPSNLYLLHIKIGTDEWLKLGYAKSVDLRITQYGLMGGAEVRILCSIAFETGNKAHAVEARIHSRYKRKRLPRKHMELYHTRGGAEECYPLTMLDTLLAELEQLK